MKAQEKKGQLRRTVPRLADAIPRQPDADTVWQAFEAALGDVLQALDEDEYLIIGSKRRQHYVQFAGEGVHGMRAEAVSNAYICDPAEYLSDVQHEQIAALGWDGPAENAPRQNPPPGFSVQGNFYLDAAAPVPAAQVSALACATLRHVYGIPHPGELEYTAFHGAGDDIRFPSLRLRRRVPTPPARNGDTPKGDTLPPEGIGGISSPMPYRVLVDDNFHFMDESERYELGRFATLAEALAASCRIVDEYLLSAFKPGMTAQQLYFSYTSFGEDPFIIPDASEETAVQFSAWDYAKSRCQEMCA